jgi:probable HAF family extracellular repeat protein
MSSLLLRRYTSAGDRAVLWMRNANLLDLGTLPGDTSSEAVAISNAADVVGCSNGPRGMHAFLWSKAARDADLGVLPRGNSSRALGIGHFGFVALAIGGGVSNSGKGEMWR